MNSKSYALTGALMLALSAVPMAQAYDFKAGSVYYNFTSPQKKGAAVTYLNLQDNLEAYLDDVTIPGTVKYQISDIPVRGIEDHALFNCQFVTSVTIEEGPTYIFDQAFSHCYSMKTLSLPSTMAYIGDYAFEYCEDLTSVTLPAALEELGTSVFTFCNSLTEIKVEEGNKFFEDADGILYMKGRNMLIQYPAGKENFSFEIPAGVKYVTDYAFCPAPYLGMVTIGPDVERIRTLTFADCYSLMEINVDEANENNSSVDGVLFDKNVETLIQYPLARATNEYALPETTKAIGPMSMTGTASVKNLVLPESLTSIGDYAFMASFFSTITCKAAVPPAVGNSGFDDNTCQNTTLFVPEESIDAYRTAPVWSSFRNIQAIGSASAGNIVSAPEAVSSRLYDLQGRPADGLTNGIVIRVTTFSDGSVTREKITL
ncbi:MAG: leucine-rich repeat domain-containing protein [Muribaculaceae bacterium]|nr:leucine-rich repeat domain-containing protein [Muribaculaceae bacterium]